VRGKVHFHHMTASKRKMLYLQKNYTPKYQFKHIPTNMMTEIFVIWWDDSNHYCRNYSKTRFYILITSY
jgi:hypothetical protein